MRVLTDSLAAAVQADAVDYAVLVEVDGEDATYRWASEAIRWSGRDYSPRLLDPGALSASLDGATVGVVPQGGVTITLANADGWASGKRPSTWRGRPCRVKEILLDVESDALRTTAFTIVAAASDRERLTLRAESPLSPYLRTLIPPDQHLVTLQRYPNAGTDVLGRVIPRLYGRCYVPMLLVDQASTPGDLYVACTDSATLSGTVVDLQTGGLAIGFSPISPPPFAASLGDPASAFAAPRDGLVVTQVQLMENIPNLGVARYADLTSPLGADVTPAQVCADLLNLAGAGHLVNSDALLTAHSHYLANSYFCDGVLLEQRPLEDWLGALAADGLMRFRWDTQLRVEAIGSRAVVGSFWPGNILAGVVTTEDTPMAQERSRQAVFYRDRSRDAVRELTGLPPSFRAWDAGSGVQEQYGATFLGRPSAAHRVARTLAQIEGFGVRRYQLTSTLRLAPLEEGDPVTLTDSMTGSDRRRCEIVSVTRQQDTTAYGLREQPDGVFDVGDVPLDPEFLRLYQRIPYDGSSYRLSGAGDNFTTTVSHQLTSSPTLVVPITNLGGAGGIFTASITATPTAQSITLRTAILGGGPWFLPDTLLAWDVRAEPT